MNNSLVKVTFISIPNQNVVLLFSIMLLIIKHILETAYQLILKNPANSQVSTSNSLNRPPPPLLPVSPLVAPANTLVSLPLKLIKAAVLAESSSFMHFHRDLSALAVYRHESGRCCSLSFILIDFLSFYLSRFSFYINIEVKSKI